MLSPYSLWFDLFKFLWEVLGTSVARCSMTFSGCLFVHVWSCVGLYCVCLLEMTPFFSRARYIHDDEPQMLVRPETKFSTDIKTRRASICGVIFCFIFLFFSCSFNCYKANVFCFSPPTHLSTISVFFISLFPVINGTALLHYDIANSSHCYLKPFH